MNALPTAVLQEEVLRALILSQCLEPLADKPGCTTRRVDSTPGTKLEYFIMSAVNSAWPIAKLVDRIAAAGGQPDVIWDAAVEAQRRSPRNRNGGKVNYGQILTLLPLVAAQSLLNVAGQSPRNVDAILAQVRPAMAATSRKDVDQLQCLADLSRDLSEQHYRRLGRTRALPQRFPNFGAYDNVLAAMNADDFAHLIMATEIRDGYPETRAIVEQLRRFEPDGLLRRSEQVFNELLPKHGRPDIVTDVLVPAFYLILVEHPQATLLP